MVLAFTKESNSNETLNKCQEFQALKKEINNLSNLRNLGEVGIVTHSLLIWCLGQWP